MAGNAIIGGVLLALIEGVGWCWYSIHIHTATSGPIQIQKPPANVPTSDDPAALPHYVIQHKTIAAVTLPLAAD